MNGTNDSGEFISTKKAKEIMDVSTSTLRRWVEENKIRAIKTSSGIRRYDKQSLYDFLGSFKTRPQAQKVVYCRVSSQKQTDDLKRQVDFFRTKYPHHTVVTDIASGINWKRKGLQTILEQAMQRTISEVVVAHRDRLCRFGFELIQWLFEKCNVKLIVLDTDSDKSPDAELADDIISIIHVYSCRSMGKRRYKNKKDKDVSQCNSEEDTETVDRND